MGNRLTLADDIPSITASDMAPLFDEITDSMFRCYWRDAEGAVPHSAGIAIGVDTSVAREEYQRYVRQGEIRHGRCGPSSVHRGHLDSPDEA